MFKDLKRLYKRNTHNPVFKALSGFSRAINRAYENRNHDIFSNGELTVIKKLSAFNPKIIFDVGANVGNYAMHWHRFNPDLEIHCFEPVAETFKSLVDNQMLKDSEHIRFVNQALSSHNGSASINIYPGDEHASLFEIKGVPYQKVSTKSIETVTGDNYVQSEEIEKIDFIKIDTEGNEMRVLEGFEQTLKNKKIDVIQFEYGYINVTTRTLLKDFYDFLAPRGYKVGKIYPKKVEFREYELKHEDFIGPNFLAVNKDKDQLIQTLS